MQKSFHEILKSKMGQGVQEKTHSESYPMLSDIYVDMLSEIEVDVAAIRPQGLGLYAKFKKAATPAAPPVEHVLTDSQERALEFFVSRGAELYKHFTVRDLKKAFRTAAKRCHPDLGGSEWDFRQLQESFNSLSAIFTSSKS